MRIVLNLEEGRDKVGRDKGKRIELTGMEVGMTDTREFDVDKNFVWSWFLYWNLLVYDR